MNPLQGVSRGVRILVGTILAVALVQSCGDDPTGPGDESSASYRAAALTISEEDVGTHVGVLAHDSMLGRWSPSPELNRVADYIAGEFSRAGLQPGNEGEFLQWFALPSAQVISGIVHATGLRNRRGRTVRHGGPRTRGPGR